MKIGPHTYRGGTESCFDLHPILTCTMTSRGRYIGPRSTARCIRLVPHSSRKIGTPTFSFDGLVPSPAPPPPLLLPPPGLSAPAAGDAAIEAAAPGALPPGRSCEALRGDFGVPTVVLPASFATVGSLRFLVSARKRIECQCNIWLHNLMNYVRVCGMHNFFQTVACGNAHEKRGVCFGQHNIRFSRYNFIYLFIDLQLNKKADMFIFRSRFFLVVQPSDIQLFSASSLT